MTPVENIADWIKDKPLWWRHSVKLSLSEGALSPIHFDEIYKVSLVEHDIISDEEISKLLSLPLDTSGFNEEAGKVTLKQIDTVVNVGALSEDQLLSFPKSGMTIIYGDNGAGKSSYSRIIKHACLSRGGTPKILGNVFEKSDKPTSANISINVNEDAHEHNWNLSFKSNENLKSIRVFDSDAAAHFVTNEDELGYKPSGLHLLEDLAEAVDYVNRQVAEETMAGNGFVGLPIFSDTKTGLFINQLSASTGIEELDFYAIDDNHILKIEELKKEIDLYKAKSPKQIKTELSGSIRQLTPLYQYLIGSKSVVDDGKFDSLKEKERDFIKKKQLADEVKDRTFSGLPISGVGDEKWKVMWGSAEIFIKSLPSTTLFPPKEKDNCPLCLQEIGDVSSKRMATFIDFLADNTVTISSKSKAILDSAKKDIKDYRFDLTPYESAIALADENIVDFRVDIESFLSELKLRKSSFTTDTLPENTDALDLVPLERLKELIGNISAKLESIPEDESSGSMIEKKEQEYKELVDKELFRDNFENIKYNLLRHKLVAKYNLLKEQCKSRPITDKNSEICKEEVITPLVDAFNKELKKIGFSRFNVSPKTRGRSGAQLLKLAILDGNEPLVSKVASEGEQRCISIACFLAEMLADKRKSAVVFDDPVNSLSHQWSHKVAKRLVEESLERQVIVLTHDIVFYKLLLEEIENTGATELNEICLERSRKRAGLVRKNPPWDALTTSKRIKQLNVQLRDLRNIDTDGTEREFREAAYNFYGYLREAWERLVEEKLLNQVVTRFGRAVQTNRLRKIIDDITQSDFDRIEKGMSRCSTYFRGHDSAPAIGDPFPTIEEVQEDLDSLATFNDELQNQRKRS
ncbi:AAA family ATPase [Halomonas sp. AOP25-F1-15]|uniref:AAA family ATPase n=1 Tax=Halomonas sp. AOP25-F1-15 TaxID=3457709 RepID=UPI004033984F